MHQERCLAQNKKGENQKYRPGGTNKNKKLDVKHNLLVTTLKGKCRTFQLRQIVRIGKTHMQVYRHVHAQTYELPSRDTCVK